MKVGDVLALGGELLAQMLGFGLGELLAVLGLGQFQGVLLADALEFGTQGGRVLAVAPLGGQGGRGRGRGLAGFVRRGWGVEAEAGGEEVVDGDEPAARRVLDGIREGTVLAAAADGGAADAARGGGVPLGQHRARRHDVIFPGHDPSIRPTHQGHRCRAADPWPPSKIQLAQTVRPRRIEGHTGECPFLDVREGKFPELELDESTARSSTSGSLL
ncbi:hypothetical protein [Streptomyces ficellus]|uniref:hypothetical protein n=1 Tax=Streptomyces ficellus TaxID=1977088 RepID=UPI0025AF21A9|nr:hypothetical protein [Streptomyces ficellus]